MPASTARPVMKEPRTLQRKQLAVIRWGEAVAGVAGVAGGQRFQAEQIELLHRPAQGIIREELDMEDVWMHCMYVCMQSKAYQ